MTLIDPIDSACQQQVVEHTSHYIALAARLYDRPFAELPVRFNLSGRASGMYRVRGKHREIRYNPWLFAAHFDDCFQTTVPHEVAHYVVDCLFGLRQVRPHGKECRAVMAGFGADASVTSNLSLAGIPQRRSRYVTYRCGCGEQPLGIRRHQRVVNGEARYACRRCGEVLRRHG